MKGEQQRRLEWEWNNFEGMKKPSSSVMWNGSPSRGTLERIEVWEDSIRCQLAEGEVNE